MAEGQDKLAQPVRGPSRLVTVARSVVGVVAAAVAGPIAVVAVGLVAWAVVRGVPGIALAAAVSLLVGGALRGLGTLAVRLAVGGLAGAAGGYLAIATAEMTPPGTTAWAVSGGSLGVGVAAALGLVAGLADGLSRPRA